MQGYKYRGNYTTSDSLCVKSQGLLKSCGKGCRVMEAASAVQQKWSDFIADLTAVGTDLLG